MERMVSANVRAGSLSLSLSGSMLIGADHLGSRLMASSSILNTDSRGATADSTEVTAFSAAGTASIATARPDTASPARLSSW
jgi:hypothetical protein